MDRFASKIEVNPVTQCWNWTGYINHDGYGKFRLNRKSINAHRAAFEMHYGPIPEGACVCHVCDNPRCCNPGHLFVGTHDENMRDKAEKGRGNKKITADQANEIREAHGTHAEIAEMFGISRSMVGHIKSGKRRAHIG